MKTWTFYILEFLRKDGKPYKRRQIARAGENRALEPISNMIGLLVVKGNIRFLADFWLFLATM